MEIRLERKEFFPGDVIRGEIIVTVNRKVLSRELSISLVGIERAKIFEDPGPMVMEKYCITKERKILWEPQTPRPEPEYFGPCEKVFPFEFQIPSQAPATLEKPWPYPFPESAREKNLKSLHKYFGKPARIQWFLKAKLDRPVARDLKNKVPFRILAPHRQILPPTPIRIDSEPKANQPVISAYMDSINFMMGEAVTGRVLLSKLPDMRVRKLVVDLEYRLHYQARGRTSWLEQKVDRVEFRDYFVGEGHQFHLQLPAVGPPSVMGRLVSLRWYVHIKLDIHYASNIFHNVMLQVFPK